MIHNRKNQRTAFNMQVALFVVFGSSLSNPALATVYVVDQHHAAASDSNPGTTLMPFKTISRATEKAVAGDRVLVKSGIYREEVSFAHSGTKGKPIVVEAVDNVTVKPLSVRHWIGAFNIIGRSDIVVRGFRVRDAYFGFKIDKDSAKTPSQRISLANNHTIMTASSGIRIAFSKNVAVDANTVEKANYGGIHEMISIIDTEGFLVRGNHVFNGSWLRDGKPVEGKEGIDVKGASRNGRVVANRVHDLTRLGIYIDAYASDLGNVKVTGNIVYRCKQGIAVSSEHGGKVSNLLISNNQTYDNINYGIVVTNWTGPDGFGDGLRENISIFNNTSYGNGTGGIRVNTRNIQGLNIVNNITAANRGPQLSSMDTNVVTRSEANLVWGKQGNAVLTGTLTGDPLFVDAQNGNFTLRPGSAALDKGVMLKAVPRDAIGTSRPQGMAYDIGAFEKVQ